MDRRELMDVARAANLTPRQAAVVRMRLAGHTFEEIGREGGHTRQGAQNIFLQAVKKIGRTSHVYPYTGLPEVFEHEISRGSPSGGFGTMLP